MICKNCGNDIPEGDQFCSFCGQEIRDTQQIIDTKDTKQGGNSYQGNVHSNYNDNYNGNQRGGAFNRRPNNQKKRNNRKRGNGRIPIIIGSTLITLVLICGFVLVAMKINRVGDSAASGDQGDQVLGTVEIEKHSTAVADQSEIEQAENVLPSAQVTETTKPAETTKRVETTKPAETTKRIETAKPVETTRPVDTTQYKTYYVTNCYETITLRESASTTSSEVCQIPLGAPVSYIETAGDGFYKISYNGKRGYALASYLTESPDHVVQGAKPVAPTPKPEITYPIYYVTNCYDTITLRESASTTAEEICQIPLGAPVSYMETARSGFYKVIYNGKTGYALASYLTKDSYNIVQGAKPSSLSGNDVTYPIYYVVGCEISITLRKEPNSSAKEICQIPLGAPVSYIETSENGYYKVIYNGKTGYALASYLN